MTKTDKTLLALSILFLACLMAGCYWHKPKIITIETDSPSPVMDRIQSCESNGQFNADGQVVIKINKNGTYDQGLFQINSIWNSQATALGYDLMKEKDNRSFALWLYKNNGTEAWSASKKCWSK